MQDQEFKSLGDIEKKRDELIEEINNSETDFKSDISDIVGEVGSLKKRERNLNVYLTKNFTTISVLIILLIIGISKCFFTYDSFLYSNSTNVSPSFPLNYNLIFFFLLFVLIIIVIILVKSYLKIISTKDSSESNKYPQISEIVKLYLKTIITTDSSESNIEKNKSPQISEHLATFGSIITSVGKIVPCISNCYDELSLLAKYRQLVNNFKQCSEFYNLTGGDKPPETKRTDDSETKLFFENLGNFIPAQNKVISVEGKWKENIAKRINLQLNKKNITISEKILILLYNEHYGEVDTNIYEGIITDEDEIKLLATVLINSNRLIEPPKDYLEPPKDDLRCAGKYRNEDIVAIIRKIQSFSLQNINGSLSKSFLILNYLKSYVKFLKDNEIDTNSYTPTVEFIINNSNNEKSVEKRVAELAYNLGKSIFSKINSLDKESVDGFANASLTLKFHDDISLRETVCKCSANNYAAAVLLSYFEKEKENDGQQVILIKQLTNDIEFVKSFLNKLKEPENALFLSQLREGHWHNSSMAILMKYVEKSTNDIKGQILNIKDYDILKKSVELAFKKVQIRTIEKLIDAQRFGVYFIIYNSGKNQESIQKIIDQLSIRDLMKTEKWRVRNDLELDITQKDCGVRPTYDFINFSNSTRIGILYKDKPFQAFKNDFLNDVKIILNTKEDSLRLGIIILKIVPSEYNFGVLDKIALRDNINIKDLDVTNYIKQLATKIPVEDQINAIKFESEINLLEIIKDKPFYDYIKSARDDLNKEESRILNDDGFNKRLLKELELIAGYKDFMSLARDLRCENLNPETINNIKQTIKSIIQKKYSANEELKEQAAVRSEALSNSFINSLKKLAVLYEL